MSWIHVYCSYLPWFGSFHSLKTTRMFFAFIMMLKVKSCSSFLYHVCYNSFFFSRLIFPIQYTSMIYSQRDSLNQIVLYWWAPACLCNTSLCHAVLRCSPASHLLLPHARFLNRLYLFRNDIQQLQINHSPAAILSPAFHFNCEILMSAVSILVWVAYWLLICFHWLQSQGALILFDSFEYLYSSWDPSHTWSACTLMKIDGWPAVSCSSCVCLIYYC